LEIRRVDVMIGPTLIYGPWAALYRALEQQP
jgi:PHP family Zn ribbon phosphoesterase